MASPDLALLAFRLSEKRLDKQETVLEELRSRTGVLLAASSLAASFLGKEAFGASGWGPLAVAAVAAFLITMAASLYVLLPREGLIFALVGSAVYEQFYGLEGGEQEVHRRLAYDLDRFWEANDLKIRQLRRGFELATAGLVVEVLALVALVADTIA
jgi:hypothetical protein